MIVDPRTGLVTLAEEECWRLLGAHSVGRLAVTVGDRPDIFPVNYALDGQDLLLRTAAGFKLAAAVLGPAVAFEIDGIDTEHQTGWSVVVHGRATEVDQTEDRLRAEQLGLVSWAGAEKPRYVRITVSEVTGRRIG